MGHEISGYKTTDKDHKNKIAYLIRGAFNSFSEEIYTALNAHDFYNHFSGNGEGKNFTKEQLIKALEYLGDCEELKPERFFVTDCLANIDENEEVFICFY